MGRRAGDRVYRALAARLLLRIPHLHRQNARAAVWRVQRAAVHRHCAAGRRRPVAAARPAIPVADEPDGQHCAADGCHQPVCLWLPRLVEPVREQVRLCARDLARRIRPGRVLDVGHQPGHPDLHGHAQAQRVLSRGQRRPARGDAALRPCRQLRVHLLRRRRAGHCAVRDPRLDLWPDHQRPAGPADPVLVSAAAVPGHADDRVGPRAAGRGRGRVVARDEAQPRQAEHRRDHGGLRDADPAVLARERARRGVCNVDGHLPAAAGHPLAPVLGDGAMAHARGQRDGLPARAGGRGRVELLRARRDRALSVDWRRGVRVEMRVCTYMPT
eukprot:Unigene14042_Nuclearia_a/m.42410 Unigene14042_Nuclearia_a/g.42410  ORF Unigene14042_Nuclearia_a/g.42410 Unigene14042_Nuclearia_a/m.42410 type:complete len:329 (-) Unigene14042_Nuclearia_a:15-1001(-)